MTKEAYVSSWLWVSIGVYIKRYKDTKQTTGVRRKKDSHCLNTSAFKYTVIQSEHQATIWDKSGSHLVMCVRSCCFFGNMVDICAHLQTHWANWWWLRLPHHRHILRTGLSMLCSSDFNQKHLQPGTRTCMRTHMMHTNKFHGATRLWGTSCGASDAAELVWQMLQDHFCQYATLYFAPPTFLWWGRTTLLFNHMRIFPSLPEGNMTAPQARQPPLCFLWSALYRNTVWFWSALYSARPQCVICPVLWLLVSPRPDSL